MKRVILSLALFLATGLFSYTLAQNEDYSSEEWRKVVYGSHFGFFKTQEAARIAQNVLDFQRKTGGWPKNEAMHRPLSEEERTRILSEKDRTFDSTIDNNATVMEMTYLAKMYEATFNSKYLDAFERGLEFLLSGQYRSGGWPQFWPQHRGYQVHITFNDNAMVNVIRLLRDVRDGHGAFSLVTDPVLIQRAAAAVEKGVDCILNTQILVDDEPTVWCQQYDRNTLMPAKARAYELPSFCTQESAEIVRLLMDIKTPDERVKASVQGAMKWFEAHKIDGIRIEPCINDEGKNDLQVVEDSTAVPVWARFYDLETEKPFFCDRDGVKKSALSEIGYERRNGYSWYNYAPAALLPKYKKWSEKFGN